ncbi:MAG: hypothetical protein A2V77_16575 [Anaeromyxobacter sp. RBG_16_69_14]|nr:MAG: hypothetical protein A2V77_16575 [Anaeromyxobacter sp. RBG_16_69_14]
MGIKKIGKKLMKIGKKSARSLGKGGSEFVEAVLQTAIGVLETELKKKGAPSARKTRVRAAAAPAKSRSARQPMAQEGVKPGAARRPQGPASTRGRAAGDQPRGPRAAVVSGEKSQPTV